MDTFLTKKVNYLHLVNVEAIESHQLKSPVDQTSPNVPTIASSIAVQQLWNLWRSIIGWCDVSCMRMQKLSIMFLDKNRLISFPPYCPGSVVFIELSIAAVSAEYFMQVMFSPRLEARDHMQLVDNGTCLSNELAETALKLIATISLIPVILLLYAVNWSESRWNGRDTMDVIIFSYHVGPD